LNTPDAHDALRIAMVAPPWYPVPPDGYGGIEQICADLADGLVALGHDVVLVATGGDETAADRVTTFDRPPEGLGTAEGARVEMLHAARANEELSERDVDLVHDHSFAGPLVAAFRDRPTVITAHGPVEDTTADLYASVDGVSLVAISESQRRSRPSLPWVATVHNGIAVETYPFTGDKDDFFLFLGRMHPTKGAHVAIEIARAAGMDIVLAAKCSEPGEQEYFERSVEPLLGTDARFIGTADAREKRDLLRRARALVFPIDWEEPFGLVMVEAMACGTPVLATRRGSVPEVVVDGETGFIREDPWELITAAYALGEIDPGTCRRHVEATFSTAAMIRGYEAVYRDVAREA
jgi:glycosyltransferase involved in cell wall biosynthesis